MTEDAPTQEQDRGTSVMRMVVEVDGVTHLAMERPLLRTGWRTEAVPMQELAMAFTRVGKASETPKSVIKVVHRSGNSLTCHLTKELKELGLDKGDLVEITLRKVRG